MSALANAGPLIPSNYSGNPSGAAYPLSIDADLAAYLRTAGRFAGRQLATPNMTYLVDPGAIMRGGSLKEYGAWATGNTSSSNGNINGVDSVDGITIGMTVLAYTYINGTFTYLYPQGTIVTNILPAGQGASIVQCSNNALASVTNAIVIFCQPVGNTVTGTTSNGSPIVMGLQTTVGMFVGMSVSAPGVPAGTTVASVDSTTQIHMNQNAGAGAGTGTVSVTVPVASGAPRIDRISVDILTGKLVWTKGTPTTNPSPPALPANNAPLHQLYIFTSPATTALTLQSNILDERLLPALSGGITGVSQVTTNAYVPTSDDLGKYLSVTAGNGLSFPAPQGAFGAGYWVVVANNSANNISLGSTGYTIDGLANLVMTPGTNAMIISDGSGWRTIGLTMTTSLPYTVAMTSEYTPGQITSDQNDYNPGGAISAGTTFYLSSDASRNITGLQGGATGRIIILTNVGSNNIVLKDRSASSSAVNRFALGADLTITPFKSVILKYNISQLMWYAISAS